jgi:hypothetical protein
MAVKGLVCMVDRPTYSPHAASRERSIAGPMALNLRQGLASRARLTAHTGIASVSSKKSAPCASPSATLPSLNHDLMFRTTADPLYLDLKVRGTEL